MQPLPPENTEAAIAGAGLIRHKRAKRVWTWVAVAAVTGIVAALGLDILGVITIPGLGLSDRLASLNADAPAPAEPVEPEAAAVSPEDAKAMRDKLLGLGAPTPTPTSSNRMSAEERKTLLDIYSSEEKQERRVGLPARSSIRAPNLPTGLTADAIYGVITDNAGATRLCMADAMRRGEVPKGRMEVELTISTSGRVSGARAVTAPSSGRIFSDCIIRRVKSWRFPSFSGDAVTVVYPYVLESGT